jgi:aquaporin Z
MTTATRTPAPTSKVRPNAAVKYATPLITEAIGTLILVFTIGAAVRSSNPLAPLAIGAILMAMVYAGGHVSGAHYNPAVTMAVLIRRRIDLRDAIAYWAAQVCGAVVGGVVVAAVVPAGQPAAPSVTGHAMAAAVVAEFLFTFALSHVVLNVATSKDHTDNGFYGLAIGFTVLAGAVAVGGISGAVFNPAVAVGGVLMGTVSASMLWTYVVVQLLAGAAAGFAFRALNPTDK